MPLSASKSQCDNSTSQYNSANSSKRYARNRNAISCIETSDCGLQSLGNPGYGVRMRKDSITRSAQSGGFAIVCAMDASFLLSPFRLESFPQLTLSFCHLLVSPYFPFNALPCPQYLAL